MKHDCEYLDNPESGKCDICYEIGDAVKPYIDQILELEASILRLREALRPLAGMPITDDLEDESERAKHEVIIPTWMSSRPVIDARQALLTSPSPKEGAIEKMVEALEGIIQIADEHEVSESNMGRIKSLSKEALAWRKG